ncbi:unnamed protein product [Pleuronectes platessa]|uniref:Uncharacterized protein n=1 Tax=Pleuronectes platessa TaxID=8262 RepID=A0A9N7TWQ1_PLEPL|nr:unnamed protein product [Pleuronectes platessa]
MFRMKPPSLVLGERRRDARLGGAISLQLGVNRLQTFHLYLGLNARDLTSMDEVASPLCINITALDALSASRAERDIGKLTNQNPSIADYVLEDFAATTDSRRSNQARSPARSTTCNETLHPYSSVPFL